MIVKNISIDLEKKMFRYILTDKKLPNYSGRENFQILFSVLK